MKNLYYLDDRPIFEIERLAADAWAQGGAQAEKEARQKYQDDKDRQMRAYTQRGRELTEEGKKKRKDIMKKMLDELRADKEALIKKREELKAYYKSLPENSQEKPYTLSKIRKIEDDLKTEYYKILEERDELPPSVAKAKAPNVQSKQYQEELLENRKREAEQRKRQEEMRKESERMERAIERDQQIRQMEQEEYHRRQTNEGRASAASIIPQASSPTHSTEMGAVVTTDSESEAPKDKEVVPFKWTPENEEQLEDILTSNMFDFRHAAREFSRVVNSNNEGNKWYEIDAKALQLRWTDIEIRKYRLAQHKIQNYNNAQVEDDEELPPLEEEKMNEGGSQKVEEGRNGSGSEGDNSGEESGKVTYYTNLEELD